MEREREENIFFNLIKNETSLTEVFCNFMKYKIFRDLFIDIINEKIQNQENRIDKSIVKFQDFDTEVFLSDNENKFGRIDLQLIINEEIYLFEIKIVVSTSLTENQPTNYLDFLNNKNENLFFILPKGYSHINEIYEKWEEKTKYPKEEIKNHNIIYWEDILEQLKKQELDKANIFINEFCEIIGSNWFYFEKIEFTKNEFDLIFSDKKDKGYKMLENVSIPAVMNKLFQIVFDTKIDCENNKEPQKPDYFGYYVNNKKYELSEKLSIWFGVDYELWEIEKFPIIIQIEANEIENDSSLEEFLKNKIEYTKFEYENGNIIFYIPLEKEVFENKNENITKVLTDKINEVIDLLKNYK
jgi:hypothetical protein